MRQRTIERIPLFAVGRSGSIMLEFVIAFPVVLVLMLACIQIAHLLIARQVVHYAAFCAARSALVTVCNTGGPTVDNDSWPTSGELREAGQRFRVPPTSEAELWACKAAAQVCAWISMGDRGDEPSVNIPDWGDIPQSGAAERKTQAYVTVANWNVRADVEHDFALVVPIVGPIMAWGLNPWSETQAWGTDGNMVAAESQIGDRHRFEDFPYPHVRLSETTWLSKPYVTVIAAGNPANGNNWQGYP